MSRVLPVLALAAALAPSTASCPPRAVTIQVTDYAFVPNRVEVRYGDTVRFVQAATSTHGVEFTFAPAATEFAEDPAAVGNRDTTGRPHRRGPALRQIGQVYEVAITEAFAPGAHHYSCVNFEHSGMIGVIVVKP